MLSKKFFFSELLSSFLHDAGNELLAANPAKKRKIEGGSDACANCLSEKLLLTNFTLQLPEKPIEPAGSGYWMMHALNGIA